LTLAMPVQRYAAAASPPADYCAIELIRLAADIEIFAVSALTVY